MCNMPHEKIDTNAMPLYLIQLVGCFSSGPPFLLFELHFPPHVFFISHKECRVSHTFAHIIIEPLCEATLLRVRSSCSSTLARATAFCINQVQWVKGTQTWKYLCLGSYFWDENVEIFSGRNSLIQSTIFGYLQPPHPRWRDSTLSSACDQPEWQYQEPYVQLFFGLIDILICIYERSRDTDRVDIWKCELLTNRLTGAGAKNAHT